MADASDAKKTALARTAFIAWTRSVVKNFYTV